MDLLRIISLKNNTLTGTIPSFSSTALEFVDLSRNQLNSSIPGIMFESDALEVVYLSNNTLTGTIPENIVNATKLRDLWLDGNLLTGTIPDPEEGELSSISEVLLNFNRLSGPVPDGLCDLREASLAFVSLHADCYPRLGVDEPNNVCAEGCCTSCFAGKIPP